MGPSASHSFSFRASLVAVDAVGRDLDFADATKGEQKFYEVLRRLFRGLFDNVTNGAGDWFV